MSGYVIGVVGTVIISSILMMIVPEGKSTSIIKGMTKLACLVVLIAPIPKLLGDENFFDVFRGESVENVGGFFENSGLNADETFIEYYCKLRVVETQTALEKEIYTQFQVSADVQISWEFAGETDVDGIKITKITVKSKATVEEEVQRKMCAYLTDSYCSEVLIE